MIKCVNCNSFNLVIKFKEKNYQIVNECYDCNEYNHIFIDDYIDNYLNKNKIGNEKDEGKDKAIYFCNKHSQKFSCFCYTCNNCLCNECLLSHNIQLHNTQNIFEMFTKEIKDKISNYKKALQNLETLINTKINYLSQDLDINKDKISFYNTQLKIINLKNIFLNINYNPDKKENLLYLISLKYLVDEFSEIKYKLLLREISNNTSFPNIDILNDYHKNIAYSISFIPTERIIQQNVHCWVNHVIQLKNGNIVSAHWNYISIYTIDRKNNKLKLLINININNGSVNHLYEYKPNKILACDNQMKIISLSEDNKNYKCQNIPEYGRKIIPLISNNKTENNKKKILIANTKGIKIYSYSNIVENDDEFKYEGIFSENCDFTSIIQINDKQVCGIFRRINDPKYSFSLWEIDLENKKYNLLGTVENITGAIGRYSITKINEDYIIIARFKGLAIISLESIEVIQYISCDDVNTVYLLNNGVILTGGESHFDDFGYYIRQWRYDIENNELQYIGRRKLHNDFINTIFDIKDGYMISCGRDGLINIFL